MITDEWQTTSTHSNLVPTSESILAQALPGVLAAPAGWRSELIRSSSSTSNDSGTNLINSNTNYFEKHEEYKTLNTADAPPIIFSSTNETNRIINEIPSSTTISSNSINEYNNASICGSSNQVQKTFITKVQQEPLVLRKTLPNNTVTYEQNVSVRYLQPPTPPPPEPIIIREVRPPPPLPQSPVKIRQRPPPPPTPPPLVIRERPPPAPPRLPSQVIEKFLTPPPRPPRRLIIERYAECPPKPADVVIERWLPYRRSDQRQILYERVPAPFIPPREPNLIIMHDQPHTRIHKEFINQGVTRADPQAYIHQYGAEIDSWHTKSRFAHLIDEADRTLPPPHPLAPTNTHHGYPSNGHSLSPVASAWERMKAASPLPHSFSSPNAHQNYHGSYPNGHSLSPVASAWERMKAASPLPHSFSSPNAHQNYYGSYPNRHSLSPIAPAWERMKAASPLPHSFSSPNAHQNYHGSYPNGHSLSPVASAWERMKAASPLPHSLPYYNNYSQHNSPYHSSIQLPVSYNAYSSHSGDIRTMIDVTPSWTCVCHPHLPSYQFPSAYLPRTVQVNCDHELHHALSGLTTGHAPLLCHY